MTQQQNVLLEVQGLKQHFPIQVGFLRRTIGYIKAVDGVNLTIKAGETLGLVGESGCGKTTLGRSILRLYEPTDGKVYFYNGDEKVSITELDRKSLRKFRRHMQIIFQDPYASLDSRMTILDIIGEPLLVNGIAKGKELEEMVEHILVQVGLQKEHMRRYPHSFSGGQRQRIAIARAIVLNPDLVVADEPVSALDVSIQAQILNLLKEMQEKMNLTFLFISHDLGVVRYVSDRIAMMYVGKLVELAPKEKLLQKPMHPYTESLLSAVPRVDLAYRKKRIILPGEAPDPSNLPSGCIFHPRCRYAKEICKEEEPHLRQLGEHQVSCHFAEDLDLKGITL
ncbi:MAG: ABC transporter ATP-binding protein [Clostridia bacterium]|jgi:peptide/nickel transport system ATP-binding protein